MILGLNQYTHSAACCLLDSEGKVLYAQAKERLTRKKHAGGHTAELVQAALETAGAQLSDIELVVANNHLFRIRPFEEALPWNVALHSYPSPTLDDHNLVPHAPKHELSHHLAHAWSVLSQAPFQRGLVVVMDGIGNTAHDVLSGGEAYTTDESLPASEAFVQSPANLDLTRGWREAETAFAFDELQLTRLFKRWTPEKTPVILHNYGFENMDSLGAVYSRVSSHVFGDWNVCGKVMGLAPWSSQWNPGRNRNANEWLMRGPLEELEINWPRLRSAARPNDWEEESARPGYAALAGDVQADLESVVLDFLVRLRNQTGEKNLCLAGGVALNSTLNGRIAREAGFEQVFIPPYPGDEGIAVGCALFGLHMLRGNSQPARCLPTPFMGSAYGESDVQAALTEAADFVSVEAGGSITQRTAQALADGSVVGWFQGRSEFGPRALGNRSLLAAPWPATMVERINTAIKKRERFRPFAPTVLAEAASDWFGGSQAVPYMSQTVPVHEACRERIPAVVHVDGSARIQTLERDFNPRYYELIEAFAAITDVPMVLNTSFNIAGEPIVETPHDALRSFLEADIDALALGDYWVAKRPFPAEADWPRVRPLHRTQATSEHTSGPTGEASVNLLCDGFVRSTDVLAMYLFEEATGERPLPDLIEEASEAFGVEPALVIERLRELYAWRIVSFPVAG